MSKPPPPDAETVRYLDLIGYLKDQGVCGQCAMAAVIRAVEQEGGRIADVLPPVCRNARPELCKALARKVWAGRPQGAKPAEPRKAAGGAR